MKQRNLPPLIAGDAYRAAEFDHFEFFGSALGAQEAILRLHLRNSTTIDLPTSDDELKRLLRVMCDAFGEDAISHLKSRGWI